MDDEARLPERDRSRAAEGRAGQSRSGVLRWVREGGIWRETAALAVALTLVLILVSAFLAQPYLIPSRSMENTLRVGDRLLVNKLAYRFGDEPRRGDVIVFDGAGSFVRQGPDDASLIELVRKGTAMVGLARSDGTDYVKRVVGTGGDRVTCCDEQGRISVNGHPVEEDYLRPGDVPSSVPFDIVVPAGRLWVMGDHRAGSRDSRDHLGDPGGGTVPVDKVIGRADRVVWPPSRRRTLDRPSAFTAVPAPDGAHG